MKKHLLLFLIFCFCTTSIYSQTLNSDEIMKLKSFLVQESAEKGKKNQEQFGISNLETVDWKNVKGLVWNSNGHLDSLIWNHSNLGGDLDIHGFSQLRVVHCEHNKLQTLDVSGNTNLIYLDCFNNELKSIDITTNINLESFCCRYNQLTQIDLSKNTKLTYFCGSGNQFEQIDLSKNKELNFFFCAANQLKTIDVSQNLKLKKVYLRGNRLSHLDFSNHPELTMLTAYDNGLETLNLSGCPKLETLTCENNELKILDLSDSPKLKELHCQNNLLHTLNINSRSMTHLFCENNYLTFSTLSQFNSVIYIYAPQLKNERTVASNQIDLRSEYEINSNQSNFIWTNDKGAVISPLSNENGIFTFEQSYVGKKINCKITNTNKPELTLEYSFTITSANSNEILEKEFTIGTEGGILYLKSNIPYLTTQVYSITGALVKQLILNENEISIPLNRGVYLVKLGNKTVRKVIIR